MFKYLLILFQKTIYACCPWEKDRGGSRTDATSQMEHFVIIVITIITKSSILDVATVLDPHLIRISSQLKSENF